VGRPALRNRPFVRGAPDQPTTVCSVVLASDATSPYPEEAMSEITYDPVAAARYESAMARVTRHFIPFLMDAARIGIDQRVLDIATGTGLAAQAALNIVGAGGHVTAADASASMVEQARRRLGQAANVHVCVADGQAMHFRDAAFDAVICSLGLMFFPDPERGLGEFHRVLRPGGHVAVSVLTVPQRSYNGRINVVAARYKPDLHEAIARTFRLGDASRLRGMFAAAGFRDVKTTLEQHDFVLPSFSEYYEPFEAGATSTGEVLRQLPEAARQGVREEVRQSLSDSGGPVTVPVEFLIARSTRPVG
jgi:ubiquinone/menaquinone biosynthesis C-methylase UbiE